MGMNLDVGKRSFQEIMSQMEFSITVQFIGWLDEKLSEFKIQGYMDFSSSSIPQWLQKYYEYMPNIAEAEVTDNITNDSQKQQSVINPGLFDSHTIKIEPDVESDNQDDVVVVIPEEVPEYSEPKTDQTTLSHSTYKLNKLQRLQRRKSKLLKRKLGNRTHLLKQGFDRQFPIPQISSIQQLPKTSLGESSSFDDGSRSYCENANDSVSISTQEEYIHFPIDSISSDNTQVKLELVDDENSLEYSTDLSQSQFPDQDTSYQLSFNSQGEIDQQQMSDPSMSHTQESSWPNRKKYVCYVCNAILSANNASRHMAKHTGHTPYSCMICGKRDSRRDNMKTHILTHGVNSWTDHCAIDNDFYLHSYSHT